MLKPVVVPMIKPAAERAQAGHTEDANNVFRVMHGFYGNLFLSKFATGEVKADGGDGGVASARAIWAHGLRTFDVEVVKTALSRVMDAHPEFPPTLPQFVQLCKACAPRESFRFALPPVKPNPEIAKKALAATKASLATTAPAHGLDLLKQAIADAVRCAGGDEGRELARLERMFARAAA